MNLHLLLRQIVIFEKVIAIELIVVICIEIARWVTAAWMASGH